VVAPVLAPVQVLRRQVLLGPPAIGALVAATPGKPSSPVCYVASWFFAARTVQRSVVLPTQGFAPTDLQTGLRPGYLHLSPGRVPVQLGVRGQSKGQSLGGRPRPRRPPSRAGQGGSAGVPPAPAVTAVMGVGVGVGVAVAMGVAVGVAVAATPAWPSEEDPPRARGQRRVRGCDAASDVRD
jgi:hypothetical protein